MRQHWNRGAQEEPLEPGMYDAELTFWNPIASSLDVQAGLYVPATVRAVACVFAAM